MYTNKLDEILQGLEKPDGSVQFPAKTCADLKMCHSDIENGMTYFAFNYFFPFEMNKVRKSLRKNKLLIAFKFYKCSFLLPGDYTLDPNLGSSGDAFNAHCNFDSEPTGETCIAPRQALFEKKKWVTEGEDKWRWFLRDIALDQQVSISFRALNLTSLCPTLDEFRDLVWSFFG